MKVALDANFRVTSDSRKSASYAKYSKHILLLAPRFKESLSFDLIDSRIVYNALVAPFVKTRP